MARVISMINLKGGVGKTTMTVALAEILAGHLGKRVLVVDLDPQTNATIMLIGEEKWEKLNEARHTLATLFRDALRRPGDPPAEFSLDDTLQQGVSPARTVNKLDLLPSSLELIETQERLATVPAGPLFTDRPIDLLHRATRSLLAEYDYVLIDCPPNMGVVTLNGLRMSDGYIIPVKPDVLSTYGIPQIMRRAEEFSAGLDRDLVPLGLIANMYRTGVGVDENTIRQLRKKAKIGDAPKLFDTFVPLGAPFAAAADFNTLLGVTLRQRWGSGEYYHKLETLAEEIHDRAEAEL